MTRCRVTELCREGNGERRWIIGSLNNSSLADWSSKKSYRKAGRLPLRLRLQPLTQKWFSFSPKSVFLGSWCQLMRLISVTKRQLIRSRSMLQNPSRQTADGMEWVVIILENVFLFSFFCSTFSEIMHYIIWLSSLWGNYPYYTVLPAILQSCLPLRGTGVS